MEALTEREMANNFSEQIKEISSQTLEAWWVGLKQDKYGDSKLNTPEKEKVAREMEWNEGGMDQELGSNNPRSRGESSGKDREEAVAALPQGGKQLGKEHHPCGAELAAIPLDSAMPDVTPSSMALEGKQWTDIAVNA